MTEQNKLERYVEEINSNILPHIDYDRLHESYATDMTYAKGVLNRLHEAMKACYGGEQLSERDGDDGFVVIPGVVRGRETGKLCIALLELDLASAGEHWGTTYLCRYGAVPQSLTERENSDVVWMSREMNAAFIPYDYGYTTVIPGDIHVQREQLSDELIAVLDDFRSHRVTLENETKPSVQEQLRETKEPAQPDKPGKNPKKADPER